MGRISKPNDCRHQNDCFNWDNFILDIIKGNYVLLIGGEAILNEERNGTSDTSTALLRHIIENLKETGILAEEFSADSFTDFARKTGRSDSNVLQLINDSLIGGDKTYECSILDMSDSLVMLLKSKLFRTVLTTTYDLYVENLLREIWGEELRVMNITGSGSDLDFSRLELSSQEFESRPTLYYVCGRVNTQNMSFAATDNNALSLTARWLRHYPSTFMDIISSKGLISVGCNFDDWLFRFLWYALKRGNVNVLDRSLRDAVAVSTIGYQNDKLNAFLMSHNVYTESDPDHFVVKMLDSVRAVKTRFDTRNYSDSKIFISYPHEDMSTVFRIAEAISNRGYHVWFDSAKLEPSDEYDKRIASAIQQCDIFIPVLSRQVAVDLENDNPRYYKDTEWRLINQILNIENYPKKSSEHTQRHGKITVLPVAINGYDASCTYHSKFPFRDKQICDLMNTSIEVVLNKIDKIISEQYV